jgi:DNA-binding transcriptional LysR family regulator
LIQEISEIAEELTPTGDRLTGCIRILAPTSLGVHFLSAVIADFAYQHPGLAIDLHYQEASATASGGRYDVRVNLGDLTESSLKARKLCELPRIVCCSPDYARKFGLPESVASLTEHTCIDYSHARTAEFWQFDGGKNGEKPVSVLMRSRIVANSFEAMRDMGIAGLGLVLLPDFLAAQPLDDQRLIPALSRGTPCPYTVSAAYPYTRHVSPKVRRFVDHLVSAFTPPLPWQRNWLARQSDDRELFAA